MSITRSLKFLQDEDTTDFRAVLTAQTAAVLKALTHEQRGDAWYVRQLEALPASQLVSQDPQAIVQTLTRLRPLAEGAADAWCQLQSRDQGRGVLCRCKPRAGSWRVFQHGRAPEQ